MLVYMAFLPYMTLLGDHRISAFLGRGITKTPSDGLCFVFTRGSPSVGASAYADIAGDPCSCVDRQARILCIGACSGDCTRGGSSCSGPRSDCIRSR